MKNIFMKTFLIQTAALFALATSLFAQDAKPFAADALAYDSGKPMAWYHAAYVAGQKDSDFVEKEILGIINSKELSYEALRLCVKLLKENVSEKSIEPMLALFDAGVDPVLPCEVLLAIATEKSDKAMQAALVKHASNEKIRNEILITMGKRADRINLDSLEKYAASDDALSAKLAIVSIGQIPCQSSLNILNAVLEKTAKDAPNRVYLCNSLCDIAARMLASGESTWFNMNNALRFVPQDFPASIGLRAVYAEPADRVEYIDAMIIKGGPVADAAVRSLGGARTFDNSYKLIAAYPKLSDKSKMIAINSFAQTGDAKFLKIFAADMDSENTDLRRTALFACLFLAPEDKDAIQKLISLLKDADPAIVKICEKVLVDIRGPLADKLMANNPECRKIMIMRGSAQHRKALWKEFFTPENISKKDLETMIEKTLYWHDLREFAQQYNSYGDEAVRMALTKIIIKKIVTMKEKEKMQEIAIEALSGILSADSAEAKFIAEKLKIDLSSMPTFAMKSVWQKKYFSRAVSDEKMKAASTAQPDIAQGFTALFNGKDLSGWAVKGGGAKFSVDGGEILGVCDPESRQNTFLCTEKTYKNFVFVCEFKWDVLGNSGVMVRADVSEDGKKISGPQVEIDEGKDRRWTGGIYGEGLKDAWKYSLSREDQEASRSAVKLDGWNTLVIMCADSRYMTWVNGVPCADLDWPEWEKAGYIGLQIHAGKQGQLRFRNVKIKEL